MELVTDSAGGGTGAHATLDAVELRAAYFCVAHVLRWRPEAPPSLRHLLDKLDTAIRAAASPLGHQKPSGRLDLKEEMEFVGTKAAAAMLGWTERRVRRHTETLGGRLIGDRLVFDAAEVRAHRDHLQGDGDQDGRATA